MGFLVTVYKHYHYRFTPPLVKGSVVLWLISMKCLSVQEHISETTSKLRQIFCAFFRWLDSLPVALQRYLRWIKDEQYNVLCTSDFIWMKSLRFPIMTLMDHVEQATQVRCKPSDSPGQTAPNWGRSLTSTIIVLLTAGIRHALSFRVYVYANRYSTFYSLLFILISLHLTSFHRNWVRCDWSQPRRTRSLHRARLGSLRFWPFGWTDYWGLTAFWAHR